MTQRLAVIGGRGWLGRAIVEVARRRDLHVTVLARRPGPDVTVVDPADARALAQALTGCDAVVNAAGDLSGDPATSERVNVDLPDRLGSLAAEAGWRLVHLGSAAEHGPGVSGEALVAETAPCAPTSVYGASKLAGTEALLRWRDKGAAVVVARVFNVVDGEMAPANPVRNLADQVRRAVAVAATRPASGPDVSGPDAGARPEIPVGDPTTVRDLSPRAHVAAAVVALATADLTLPSDPLVNVCSGVATGFGDLARTMGARLEADVDVHDLGWPRGGRIVGDPSRLRSLVVTPRPLGPSELADLVLGHTLPRSSGEIDDQW